MTGIYSQPTQYPTQPENAMRAINGERPLCFNRPDYPETQTVNEGWPANDAPVSGVDCLLVSREAWHYGLAAFYRAGGGAVMILPFSVTRCAGRPHGLGPNDPVCERRHRCVRYLAMIGEDREVYPNGYPLSVHVSSGLCAHGADRFRPADGQGVEG